MRIFATAATIVVFLASAAQAQNGQPPAGGGDQRVLSDKMAALALVPEMAATIDLEVPGGLAGPDGSLKRLYSGVMGGERQSFPLQWTAGPAATMSYAIIVQDTPTAEGPFANTSALHWGVYNIPGDVTALPGNIPAGAEIAGLGGAIQIPDRAGNPHYGAPGAPFMQAPTSPPRDESEYGLYTIQLFALDTKLDVKPDATYEEFIAAAAGHVLAYGIEPIVLDIGPGGGPPAGGPPGAGNPGGPNGGATPAPAAN